MNSWQVSKVNHHNRTHSITLNFFSAAIWDSCIHVFSPLMRNNYNPPFCFHVDRKLSSQGKRQIVNVVCPSAGFVTFFFLLARSAASPTFILFYLDRLMMTGLHRSNDEPDLGGVDSRL